MPKHIKRAIVKTVSKPTTKTAKDVCSKDSEWSDESDSDNDEDGDDGSNCDESDEVDSDDDDSNVETEDEADSNDETEDEADSNDGDSDNEAESSKTVLKHTSDIMKIIEKQVLKLVDKKINEKKKNIVDYDEPTKKYLGVNSSKIDKCLGSKKNNKYVNDDICEKVIDKNLGASVFRRIFGNCLNDADDDYDEYDDDYDDDADKIDNLLNDDVECNSDDEKVFMKENFLHSVLKESANVDKTIKNDIIKEYKTLIELKESLQKSLSIKPKSKILKKTLEKCKSSINKLVKDSRNSNTNEYYELIQGCNENACEMTYFRNKLSNTEQKLITTELKDINKQMNIDKPYRLSLLLSDIPVKYKTLVLHKLNSIKKMESGGPEYYKMKHWIDTFMKIPFNIYENLSVKFDDGRDACNNYIVNSKRTLDECVYGHNNAKLQILQMVGQWMTNPSAMGTSIAIHGPPGSGKCHGYDTPVLMYNGTIKMVQDIIIGDVIMGDDSTSRNVISLGSGNDMLFDINTADGKYTVNSEHILCLKKDTCLSSIEIYSEKSEIMYHTTNYNFKTFEYEHSNFKSLLDAQEYINTKAENIIEISVNDYLKLPKQVAKYLYGYKVSISFNSIINSSDLYSPYYLGMWLGSYKTNTNIIPYSFKQYVDIRLKSNVTDDEYCDKFIKQQFNLGLMDTLNEYEINGRTKHIPSNYKLSCKFHQLEILAGIIDSIGYTKNRTYRVMQYKPDNLTDDIIFIARSLGFPTYLTKIYDSFGKTFYEIEIRGNIGIIPVQNMRNYIYNGVEYPSNSISTDPYTLGVWLGDRTIGDNESMFHHGCSRQEKLREKFYCRYKELKKKLEQHIEFKHIPIEYKLNSRDVRINLLAGIIDSCGYIHRTGCYRITCFDFVLSEDIIALSKSLGFDYEYNTYDRNWKVENIEMSGSYYTIDIYGLLDIIPIRLFKNKIEDHYNYHNSLSKPITITQKGTGKYYGFELDGNNRYVLGTFDVTHNTSIVKDGISKILGRKFAFIALGGAGDSAFLEGHSYTYEGSTWGKIVQVIIDSKCMNPVIYFDELDKISDSPRGQEITSVLTHLTDTTQNDQFQDKFFSEINFDLSKCLFIFSYNDESKVNPILLDRMYRIQTKGYSFKEKMVIAKKYMLPKIREQVNFKEDDIIIPDDSLEYLISNTKFSQNEQGVRNLKRSLEIIHTKLNLFRLVNTESASIFGNELALNVEFPYTVTRHSIDALIKSTETEISGLLTMYV